MGVPAIGLYKPTHIEPLGFERAAGLVRDFGIPVSIYAAAGGWVSGRDFLGRPCDLAVNLAILDEARELGAPVVSVLGGGLLDGDTNLSAATGRVVRGLRELVPYAEERSLRLAIECLHPNYAPDSDVIITLGNALDIIDRVGSDALGVVVDTYHQWWEPDLLQQLRRAVEANRVCLVQISDWSPEMVTRRPFSRVLLGEGCIDFDAFAEGLRGYTGMFDIEVLRNPELQDLPMSELLDRLAAAYEATLGRLVD